MVLVRRAPTGRWSAASTSTPPRAPSLLREPRRPARPRTARSAYAAIGLIGPRAKELLKEIDLNPSGRRSSRRRSGCFEYPAPAERGPQLWDYLLEAGAPYDLACVGHDALDRLAAAHRFD